MEVLRRSVKYRWLRISRSRFTTVPIICLMIMIVSFLIVNWKHQYRVSVMLNVETWYNFFTTSTQLDKESLFQEQWLRMLNARVNWRKIFEPCINHTELKKTKPGWGEINETSAKESFVKFLDVRPAGQFSRIFIQARTKDGRDKTIGGDFWKVTLTGTANISATVLDHSNGTYEALVLLMDAGVYHVHTFLERSLCAGFKEHPKGSFKFIMDSKLEIQRNESDGITLGLQLDNPIFQALQENKDTSFRVPPTNDDIHKRLEVVSKLSCKQSCRLIWNGYGRWIKNKWIPFLRSENHNLTVVLKNQKMHPERTLLLFGDSVTCQFGNEYALQKNICKTVYKRCFTDCTNLYPLSNAFHKKAYLSLNNKAYGNLTDEFKLELILDALKDLLDRADMKDAQSILLLNFNIHYVKHVTFEMYQQVIQNIISILKQREHLFGSKVKVVWRTTTATLYKKKYPRIDGRFLTSSRSRLFAAYALSEICKAGIDILDLYPMSASSLTGPKDNFHFSHGVFPKAMDALTWYAITEPDKRTQDICFG